MLFKKVKLAYTENHTKYQMASYWLLKQLVHIVTTWR
jgi:hypothetical protein